MTEVGCLADHELAQLQDHIVRVVFIVCVSFSNKQLHMAAKRDRY